MDKKESWEKLEHCGHVIWGNTWQAELTRALELKNSSHVRLWKQRGVPDHVWDKLRQVGKDKIKSIEHLLQRI